MKWDYQVREYQAKNLADLERALAAAGAGGWELVIIIPHQGIPPPLPPVSLAIFKKPSAGGAVDTLRGSTVTVTVQLAPDAPPVTSVTTAAPAAATTPGT